MGSNLEPKPWCLILGASSGIGKGCALALSELGMNVIGIHLDPSEKEDELNELLAKLKANKSETHFFNINAANPSARNEVISEIKPILKDAGGIKVLVHSLAFGSLLPFIPREPNQQIIDQKRVEMTFTVMAHSLVYWTQDLFCNNLFVSGAKIFALTSAGSTRVSPNYGAVSGAKCALEAYVRQLAVELAPHNIAVNAIRAGVTLTPALMRIPEHGDMIERAKGFNPSKRLTLPEDVGAAVAALSAHKSSWITGISLVSMAENF